MAKATTDIRTLEEATTLTGVPRRTLQRWLGDGELTAYGVHGDRQRYVDVNEIKRLRTPQPVNSTRRKS